MMGIVFRTHVLTLAMAMLLLMSNVATAGEFNPTLSIGDKAPKWTDLPGTDDKTHSLADLKKSEVIVVAFTCNSCPYAVDVEDRMIALAKKYADKKFSLIAIGANDVEADALPAMKERAKKKEFKFAYLYDESQEIAKEFGALRTPEFFVLNKERKIVYMGSFDDSPDGKKVTKKYVESAIDATFEDKAPEVTETIAIGCGIRFKRERRKRD